MNDEQLDQLIDRYFTDELDDSAKEELTEWLDADHRNQERFVSAIELNHALGHALSAESEEEPDLPNVIKFPSSFSLPWILAAAAALLMAGFFLSRSFTPAAAPEVAAEPEPVPDFVLTRAIDVEWEHPTKFRAEVGQPIPPKQRLRLKSGIAQIEFASGATVTIEGPATLRVDDPMRCFSMRGKLTANCPPSAYGFMIKFAGGRVIDLGTEFAMNSKPKGETEVHVFEGEVVVARTDEDDRVLTEQNLPGHSAVTVGDRIESIDYDDSPYTDLKRNHLIQSQPIKLQFDLGHRAGLYTGSDAPAHAAGDMFEHENNWTQIVGDQSGTFVMADGNVCPHPIQVDYGHGDGEIDWDAEPVDPWGKVHTKAEGVFDTALAQDHRPWDEDLGLRVRGLPAGTYRVYALCRSARRPGAFYEVSFGTNLDRQLADPIEIPPMDPDAVPEWIEGVTYETEDVEITGPDDWLTFITRYSRERSVRSTPHHGRSVLLGLQIVEIR